MEFVTGYTDDFEVEEFEEEGYDGNGDDDDDNDDEDIDDEDVEDGGELNMQHSSSSSSSGRRMELRRVTGPDEDLSYAAQFADIPVYREEVAIVPRGVNFPSNNNGNEESCGNDEDDDDDDDDMDEVDEGHRSATAALYAFIDATDDIDDDIDDDLSLDDEEDGPAPGPLRTVHEEAYPVEHLAQHSEKVAAADEVLIGVGQVLQVIREVTKGGGGGGGENGSGNGGNKSKNKKNSKKGGKNNNSSNSNSSNSNDMSMKTSTSSTCETDLTVSSSGDTSVQISLPSTALLVPVSTLVVILSSGEAYAEKLSIGTILCLGDRQAVGKILEVLGPIQRPYYTIKLLSQQDGISLDNENFNVSALQVGLPIYTTARWMKPISRDIMHSSRGGTDASNAFDEEIPEDEQEFSDDEKELAAKQARNKAKRANAASKLGESGKKMDAFSSSSSNGRPANRFMGSAVGGGSQYNAFLGGSGGSSGGGGGFGGFSGGGMSNRGGDSSMNFASSHQNYNSSNSSHNSRHNNSYNSSNSSPNSGNISSGGGGFGYNARPTLGLGQGAPPSHGGHTFGGGGNHVSSSSSSGSNFFTIPSVEQIQQHIPATLHSSSHSSTSFLSSTSSNPFLGSNNSNNSFAPRQLLGGPGGMKQQQTQGDLFNSIEQQLQQELNNIRSMKQNFGFGSNNFNQVQPPNQVDQVASSAATIPPSLLPPPPPAYPSSSSFPSAFQASQHEQQHQYQQQYQQQYHNQPLSYQYQQQQYHHHHHQQQQQLYNTPTPMMPYPNGQYFMQSHQQERGSLANNNNNNNNNIGNANNSNSNSNSNNTHSNSFRPPPSK